jgi:hypothetical protein
MKLIFILQNEPRIGKKGNDAEPRPDVSLREKIADMLYCTWVEAFLTAKSPTV